jgi:hypothetical protein
MLNFRYVTFAKAWISTENIALSSLGRGLPKVIIDKAWQAQLRLCKRHQRMLQKGKHYNLIKVTIAREMSGLPTILG